MKVKISVIIPVYNVEKYLPACLDSIVSQTLGDIEILCVNDGSTDSSRQILEEYQKNDKRICIFDKENGGQGSARNYGLKSAGGEYVIFVDSDDWLEKDALEKIYRKIKNDDSDILLFNANIHHQKNNILTKYNYVKPYYNLFKNTPFCPEEAKDVLFLPAAYLFKAYKTEFLKKCNYHYSENKFWEDHLPHITALSSANKISVLNEYIYNYRKNALSSTANAYKYSDTVFSIFRECEQEIIKNKRQNCIKSFLAREIINYQTYIMSIPFKHKKKWYKEQRKVFKYIESKYSAEIQCLDINKTLYSCVCNHKYETFILVYTLRKLFLILKTHFLLM